jgi:predicted ester cyclase
VSRQRAAYPDAHVIVEELIAEGDRVAARISMTGTPADGGRPIRYRGTVWWRIADGKIVERWGAAFASEKV